ncbi:MAG TPA: hypothetical protein VD884_02530 [Ohtaekwangia sp.]|nr:hypothetical protein [Ohtaekwangia sp.]
MLHKYTMAYAQSIVLIDDDADDQEIFRAACNLIGDSIQLIPFDAGESALHAIPSITPSPDFVHNLLQPTGERNVLLIRSSGYH